MGPVTPLHTLAAVSWCMPPALYPRSIQVGRLLKGLRRLGWRSLVVTPGRASRPADEPRDESLEYAYTEHYETAPVDLSRVDPEFGPFWSRWRERRAGESLLSRDQLWTKRGAAVAARVLRSHRVDALVTFAQPWSDHVIGLEVAGRGALPWVAHFSDPWVDGPYAADLPADARAQAAASEARVVERADRVVFTNTYTADLVMGKYPEAWRAKASVIPHALDEDLAVSTRPAPAAGRPLRLSHVGNLFVGRRRANGIIEALAAMHAQRSLEGRLELVLLGEGSGLYEAREQVFVRKIEKIVRFEPRVPYLDSLKAMAESDVLLLIDAPAAVNLFLPSKLVDYLAAARPVLALTPAMGPSADVMRLMGYPVVEPDDVPAITAQVQRLLDGYAAGTLAESEAAPRYRAEFALDVAARAFHDLLQPLVGRRP